MWNSFNSPGNENLKPDKDTGLLNGGVHDAKSSSGGHSGNSGASKPSQRPVRILNVSPSNGESNFEHDTTNAPAIKRSPLKSLYESRTSSMVSLRNYDQSPLKIMRSPQKNKLSTKNDFSPSGKSIQRISTILVHRQRSDMAVITGLSDGGESFDRNLIPSSSKSAAARVIESKAVRIRLNGNKTENSIEILGSPNSNSCSLLDYSTNSHKSGKAASTRRQSNLQRPRTTSNSNSKSTGKTANELSMSSFKSPLKKTPSSFKDEGGHDSKVGFSESKGLFFFSPADTSSKLPIQRPTVADQWECGVGGIAATSSGISSFVSPVSSGHSSAYNTPYTSGAGVSLSRSSIQRSHAKPTLSSASREKDLKRGTPDKAKPPKHSPLVSPKTKKLVKAERLMSVTYSHSHSPPSSETGLAAPEGTSPSPSQGSTAPHGISPGAAFLPEVQSHSDVISFVHCLSPKRSRDAQANINALVVQLDAGHSVSDSIDNITDAATLDAPTLQEDFSLGSPNGFKVDYCDENDVSSDESYPRADLVHVTRVQMRSQHQSNRGSPFSFPRSACGPIGTPTAMTSTHSRIEQEEKQFIADTANNLTSSINGIRRSMVPTALDPSTRPSDDCRDRPMRLRESSRSNSVREAETDSCRQRNPESQDSESRGYIGSKVSTSADDSLQNSSLCFSAESCVNSSQMFKLPEDSFCKSDYYELLRLAREENMKGLTPIRVHPHVADSRPIPVKVLQYAAQPTSWLCLQSPIDKMHRGLPKSAVKNRASSQVDLLYTPEPSHPYLRRSASRDRDSEYLRGVRMFKANGEELEEGEIDEGVYSHEKSMPEVARSSDTIGCCPGLDELLWGPNATSPSDVPIVPNSLTFSSASTPLLHRGCRNSLRAGTLSSSPFNLPFSLDQADAGQYSPFNQRTSAVQGESSVRPRPRSASLSLMGSAVRMSPKAAQLTEDLAAADALVLMMQMAHLSPTRPDDPLDIQSNKSAGEEEVDADDSSIFALDCQRDDRRHESECDSESERSQIQEISAVLKNLREGDVCCRKSSEREEAEGGEEDLSEVRPLDFALGITSSIHEDYRCSSSNAAAERSAEGEAALELEGTPECSTLALRDESALCSEDPDSSALYTTATTISLDFPHDSTCANSSMLGTRRAKKDGRSKVGGLQTGPLPNLLLTQKKRRKDASIEMKEIVLKATPGGTTTVALNFGTSRPGAITLRPKAILVRYEPSKQASAPAAYLVTGGLETTPGTPQRITEEEERERNRRLIFTVSPESLPLLPGSESCLHVTFSPTIESSGVYSGALKIKAGNKSFVMLLRGEVVQTHAVQGHSAGRCSGQGEISADCIEGHGEAAETKAAQALSLQGPSMIEYSPARDRDREPGPDIVARHSWAKEEGRASSMLSTSNLNYEGSILSLDNALTRAISTSRGVKGYSNDISAAAGQQLIDDIEMQQDKVRHWLEMEKDRLLGPNPRSVSVGGSPRLASAERGQDVMSPEQFRNALKLRTFDSSPSRAVNTYGAVQAAATESPSRPSLKGSQTVSLTARMQAVSPNHLFDTSTARMGAWIDERSAQSDRAVVSSTGTLAAERSRRSSGTTQTQTQYTSAAGVRNTSQSQPRVLYGAPAEEQEQFDLHLRDTVTQGLGLSLNAGSVGVPSAKGTWTHRAPEMKRSPSASLYFRSQVANFGMTAVGTNARQKLELCNSSGEEVTVYIGDCALPFVVLHNEVTLRPRSFVKVAVRFVPVSGPKEFRSQLIAQTADGKQHTEASLYGSSYWA